MVCTCSATRTAARVALQMALRWPQRLRSLTLYEPVRFELLFGHPAAQAAAEEIVGIGARVQLLLQSGVPGLRISEALDLRLDDVDLQHAVLRIRIAKLDRSRLVPIHLTTRDMLTDHLQRRARFLGSRPLPYVFISNRGTPARSRARASRVLCAVAPDGSARTRREQGSKAARLPSSTGRRGADALVSVGRGRGAATAGAIDVPWPRRRGGHVLVPERRAGADDAGDGAAGAALGNRHERRGERRRAAASLLHAAVDAAAPGQHAHDRLVPRHLPPAAAVRAAAAAQPRKAPSALALDGKGRKERCTPLSKHTRAVLPRGSTTRRRPLRRP